MPTFANRIYATNQNFSIVEKLNSFAKEQCNTLLELAFSWMATRPTVASIIAGATKPEQIDANVNAIGWEMTPEQVSMVDNISQK